MPAPHNNPTAHPITALRGIEDKLSPLRKNGIRKMPTSATSRQMLKGKMWPGVRDASMKS